MGVLETLTLVDSWPRSPKASQSLSAAKPGLMLPASLYSTVDARTQRHQTTSFEFPRLKGTRIHQVCDVSLSRFCSFFFNVVWRAWPAEWTLQTVHWPILFEALPDCVDRARN